MYKILKVGVFLVFSKIEDALVIYYFVIHYPKTYDKNYLFSHCICSKQTNKQTWFNYVPLSQKATIKGLAGMHLY